MLEWYLIICVYVYAICIDDIYEAIIVNKDPLFTNIWVIGITFTFLPIAVVVFILWVSIVKVANYGK